MIGCVTALTKTTSANGATIAIPGSHLWSPDRRPLDKEAIPAELEVGDAFIFLEISTMLAAEILRRMLYSALLLSLDHACEASVE